MENDANIKFENTNELSVDEFAKIVASCYACKVFTRTFENRVIVAIDTFLPGYDEGVCNVLEKSRQQRRNLRQPLGYRLLGDYGRRYALAQRKDM